jgi:hypothetical protein
VIVEQAIFTSVRSRKSQGYHLVGASSGLDDEAVRLLGKWGPSHASLLSSEVDAESFNYHPVNARWHAVSRTVHGGPEYSGRGGLQVFTHFLLVRPDQWEGYDNNPLALARTAQALGYLRLHRFSNESLPSIQLPDHAIPNAVRVANPAAVPLHDILRVLRLQNRVAILGFADPLPVLALVLKETPRSERLGVSFSTGLRLSVDRDFRIHFAKRADATINAQLASQGIDFVTAT